MKNYLFKFALLYCFVYYALVANAGNDSAIEKTINTIVGDEFIISPWNDASSIFSGYTCSSTSLFASEENTFSINVNKTTKTNYPNYSTGYTEGYYSSYRVQALKTGVYTIMGRANCCKRFGNYYSASPIITYHVVVSERPQVTSISIPQTLTLNVDDVYTFSPIIYQTGALTTLTWTSSNPSVVMLDNQTIKAQSQGVSLITCTASNGVSAQCIVTVNPNYATDISLNHSEGEIEINKSIQLLTNIFPSNVTSRVVEWKSSDENVAIVSTAGLVVGISPGWASITATTVDGSNLSASCLIHVVSPLILAKSLNLDVTYVELVQGNKAILTPTLLPTNVSSQTLIWKSSDECVATVDDTGVITTHKIGNAVVTATTTDGTNLTASCNVKVKSKSYLEFENIVYFKDALTLKNNKATLFLQMKNVSDITAVQFDLALPNGVTIAMNDKGTAYDITYVEERVDGTTHTLNSALQEDGTVRVLCYSTANELFLGNEGAILNFPILVSDLESGAYNIILQNIVITDINGNKSYIDAIGSILNVLEATPGDANGDNEIDVADIVAVANHILGSSPEDFLVEAADFDSDGTVDVADIVNIANCILGGNISEARILARKVLNAQSVDLGFSFDVLPFVFEEKGTKTVTLDLCNPDVEFTAFQCDLYLPDGLNVDLNRRGTAYNFSFNADADRTDATYHTLSSAKQEDGSIRILCYSTTNEIFLGEEGALLNIPLTADATLKSGVYELSLANIVLTYANGVKVKPEAYKGSILVGDGGEVKIVKLYGRYTADVLDVFSAALSLNTQITSIDLMETVSLEESGALTTGNPNTLIYLSESMMLANESNIVRGEQCSNIQLTDGCPFNVDKSFTATAATYQRTLAKEGWYSLCLPFAANKPAGATVERFSELDASAGTVVFSEGDIAANVPCIFNAPAGNITFSASDVEIVKTPEKMNDGAFVGVYDKTGEGAIVGSYALFADGSGFGIAGTTAYAEPFRAYIEAERSNAKTLRLIHGETTGVDLLEKEVGERSDIYSIDGRYAGRSIEQLPKGIYIINNKKLIK